MSAPRVRIGTRGSALALAQTALVVSALQAQFPRAVFETRIIRTRGDRIQDAPLSQIGGKGLFIQEIEEALLAGEIDLAVHSLKDLPAEPATGLALGGVLERGEVRDALVSAGGRRLAELDESDLLATSSLRRQAQVAHHNPRVRRIDIRGNVENRLRKMEQGACSALILAAAGLSRLGLDGRITELLEPEVMLPAPGQGIIALEIRAGERRLEEMAARINHGPTWAAARVERAFLARVEGGCQVPVGCLSSFRSGRCTLRGLIADPADQGGRLIRREIGGPEQDGVALAVGLAERILEEGGQEILERIRASR